MAVRLGPARLALPTLELGDPAVMTAPDGRPVQTWPDPSGSVRVSAYRVGDTYWIDWPGVARFIVTPGTGVVRGIPDQPSGHIAPSDAFERFIVPLAWQAAGGEALHASAVCWGASAVAFCARSGSGKSTVACGLALRGRPLLTDDGLLIDSTAVPADVTAAATRLRLRAESSTYFELSPASQTRSVSLDEIPTVTHGILRGFVVLKRVSSPEPPEMRRLLGGEALAAVLAHAHSIEPGDTTLKARSLNRYLTCLASTTVWHLRYPSGFAQLPGVLDLIEQTIEASL